MESVTPGKRGKLPVAIAASQGGKPDAPRVEGPFLSDEESPARSGFLCQARSAVRGVVDERAPYFPWSR